MNPRIKSTKLQRLELFDLFIFCTFSKNESIILAFWRLIWLKTESRKVQREKQLLLLYCISMMTLVKDPGTLHDWPLWNIGGVEQSIYIDVEHSIDTDRICGLVYTVSSICKEGC